MAILVAGLFLMSSCAKKTVVSDATTIEDQTQTADEAAMAAKKAEEERIRQQELQEEMAKNRRWNRPGKRLKKTVSSIRIFILSMTVPN